MVAKQSAASARLGRTDCPALAVNGRRHLLLARATVRSEEQSASNVSQQGYNPRTTTLGDTIFPTTCPGADRQIGKSEKGLRIVLREIESNRDRRESQKRARRCGHSALGNTKELYFLKKKKHKERSQAPILESCVLSSPREVIRFARLPLTTPVPPPTSNTSKTHSDWQCLSRVSSLLQAYRCPSDNPGARKIVFSTPSVARRSHLSSVSISR